MKTLNDVGTMLLDRITTVVLTLLAAPLVVFRALRRLPKLVRTAERLASGTVVCPYCAAENPLNLMTRCPTCGAVEPGSRLRCSFCRTVFDVIPCAGCGATLRVL